MASVYILETSPDLLHAVSDMDGRIVKCNPLFRSYTSHIKPVYMTDVVVESDKELFIQAIEKAKKLKPTQVSECVQTRQKNGANRYVGWSICEINMQLWFVGIQLFDVISVTSYQHERLKAIQSDAAFIASHDIKQPISSAKGLTAIIKELVGDNEELLSLVNMLSFSVNQADEATNQLVDRLTKQF